MCHENIWCSTRVCYYSTSFWQNNLLNSSSPILEDLTLKTTVHPSHILLAEMASNTTGSSKLLIMKCANSCPPGRMPENLLMKVSLKSAIRPSTDLYELFLGRVREEVQFPKQFQRGRVSNSQLSALFTPSLNYAFVLPHLLSKLCYWWLAAFNQSIEISSRVKQTQLVRATVNYCSVLEYEIFNIPTQHDAG